MTMYASPSILIPLILFGIMPFVTASAVPRHHYHQQRIWSKRYPDRSFEPKHQLPKIPTGVRVHWVSTHRRWTEPNSIPHPGHRHTHFHHHRKQKSLNFPSPINTIYHRRRQILGEEAAGAVEDETTEGEQEDGQDDEEFYYTDEYVDEGEYDETDTEPAEQELPAPSVPSATVRETSEKVAVVDDEDASSVRAATKTHARGRGKKNKKQSQRSAGSAASKKILTSTGGSKGGRSPKFRGIEGGVKEGTNITHLSYMMLKLIKTYKIRSMVDMPCRNNLEWFPELLSQIDFEVLGFKYYCVDSDERSQDDIRHLFSDAGSPEFMSITPEEAHQLPYTDLVFCHDGPQEWGIQKAWTFFSALRRVRPKYVMVTNNPGEMNHPSGAGVVNLRKQPFHFDQAKRVLSGIYTSKVPKQFLFYEMNSIRKGF